MQRTRSYRWLSGGLFGVADMQRIDMGIAMCHFELTAIELGLDGDWIAAQPNTDGLEPGSEYTISWLEETG